MTQDTSTRTQPLTPRAEVIAYVLTQHQPGDLGYCICGYQYPRPAVPTTHEADTIDAALYVFDIEHDSDRTIAALACTIRPRR